MSWSLKSFPFSLRKRFRQFEMKPMSTLSYRDAVSCLNSLQSNAATLEAIRASGGRLSNFAISEMLEYLERIGYQVNACEILHIISDDSFSLASSTSWMWSISLAPKERDLPVHLLNQFYDTLVLIGRSVWRLFLTVIKYLFSWQAYTLPHT